MRYVSAGCLRPNMLLGKNIYRGNGELLLASGIVLTDRYINKIQELNINGLYIEDDLSKDIEIVNVIDENLRINTVKGIKDIFIYSETTPTNKISVVEKTKKYIEEIISEIVESKDLIVNVIDLKVFDDYTYFHSVNVAVLSIVMGVALSLKRDELYELALAALLHDIGKVFVDKNILNKNGRLDKEEFAQIQTHSAEGYNLLKKQYDFPAMALQGVIDHHERFDGSGYPSKKSGKNISLYGRIIAVADVYDALTSDRPYRKAMLPAEAMEYIMAGSSTMFDREIVAVFIRKVAPYPIGTAVGLSNGWKALVIKNYEDSCLRPLVRVYEKENQPVDPYELNLRDDHTAMNITITATNV